MIFLKKNYNYSNVDHPKKVSGRKGKEREVAVREPSQKWTKFTTTHYYATRSTRDQTKILSLLNTKLVLSEKGTKAIPISALLP